MGMIITRPQKKKPPCALGTVSHAYTATEAGVSPLEDMGYEVEIVMFDDFITPDTALDEGSIDANLYQHLTFLNNYNEEHNTDLVFMEPIVYPFAGLYSVNYESLEDLMANGAAVKSLLPAMPLTRAWICRISRPLA